MRFYAETDGDKGHREYYVVDRYADPTSEQRRTECDNMPKAVCQANQWNYHPPWPVWDTIQAIRENYEQEHRHNG